MNLTEYVPTCSCGARLHRTAQWCGQCLKPARHTVAHIEDFEPRTGVPISERGSRWHGSEVTFGPVGRLVITLLALLPFFGLLTIGLRYTPMALIALAAYSVILLPWILRDTWRRA